jgi:L-iditol 2-dehydrogenase
MAEFFAVSPDLLTDTLLLEDLEPTAGALIEPLACVIKSLWRLGYQAEEPAAVVGLGVMGLMHMLLMPGAIGYDTNPLRLAWARNLGLDARHPDGSDEKFDSVVVCPGSEAALGFGLSLTKPDARVCLFAPLPPGQPVALDLESLYFQDIRLVTSYSCGPDDTRQAFRALKEQLVRPKQVVSDFIALDDLPLAYLRMKEGKILKAMVTFP